MREQVLAERSQSGFSGGEGKEEVEHQWFVLGDSLSTAWGHLYRGC